MAKESKPRQSNPFKITSLKNPRVDVFTSRKRSKSKLKQINGATSKISSPPRLDIDALIEGLSFFKRDTDTSGLVNVPNNKQTLHPATLFKSLCLTKAQANGLDNKDLIVSLGITEQQFNGFLNKDVRVNRALASKLRMVTGMPDEFWLRVQAKFDSSHKEQTDCKSMELFEITIHLNVGDSSLSMDDIDDHLYEAGFDDAFISHNGKGAISVSIERVASTEKELFDEVKEHLNILFPNAVLL